MRDAPQGFFSHKVTLNEDTDSPEGDSEKLNNVLSYSIGEVAERSKALPC